MLGSAWIEDLERVLPALRGRSDSLVVVPHDLSPSNLERMKRRLEEALPGRYLLVDVMGVLVELYPLADWAFVGGGFGKGIHSTVEPAVSGLRIACGPEKVERFPETRELIERGILRICRSEVEVEEFIDSASPGASVARPDFIPVKRDRYRRLLESCLTIR
jgi:3-deoxy-D-manno-octulosonic-acid transferase